MRKFLRELFLENIPRKLVAILTAIIIFLFVNQSLTTSKTVNNISVRLINVPSQKTVEGLMSNGYLLKKVSLTLSGKKSSLEEISAQDIEIVIDVGQRKESFTTTITEKNLVSLNPQVKINRDIRKVSTRQLYIQILNLITEKIPVYLLKPSGEAPKGYQFVDINPHVVFVDVMGPEETIRKLKSQGLIKIYNLSDISQDDLDSLHAPSGKTDVVSYTIPLDQRYVYIPSVAPDKKFYFENPTDALKIDFLRTQILPIDAKLPVTYFIPTRHPKEVDVSQVGIVETSLVSTYNDIKVLTPKIFAKNVSQPFLEIVQYMMEIVVCPPILLGQRPSWSLELIGSKDLEDRYVTRMLQETSQKQSDQSEMIRRELYKNRFRLYMNQMVLTLEDGTPLDFTIQFKGSKIYLQQKADAS
jgi:hypothetical protein